MNQKKIIIAITSFFIVTIIFAICFNIKPVKASDGISREKCVSSIKIEEGDTLWSIASKYYTTDYYDINELVEEIKQSNHIDDTIFIGQHIIVPHYREIS
ncbi:MAG: LysM peptidoglycan-binding domain-containing protein [Velocimicrobium sp.]